MHAPVQGAQRQRPDVGVAQLPLHIPQRHTHGCPAAYERIDPVVQPLVGGEPAGQVQLDRASTLTLDPRPAHFHLAPLGQRVARAAGIAAELATLVRVTAATFAALDVVAHLRPPFIALAAQEFIDGFVQHAAHALANPVPQPCLAFLHDFRKQRTGVDMLHFWD